MPVCKCRKATKLYCFVHRTPVCFDCICATEHEHCVVWQYSDWVNDGDYDWPPHCPVCDESLEDSDKPTVRLGCLHVPHSECLQRHLESFPAHTAPAGYTCPSSGCQAAVWPPRSQKDAASTLYTTLRALIAGSSAADTLLVAHIPPIGYITPPTVSREASTNDLTSVGIVPPAGPGASGAAAGTGTGAGAGVGVGSQHKHPEVQVDMGKAGLANGGAQEIKSEQVLSPQKLGQQVTSPQMSSMARSRGSGYGGSVAVDVQEDFSKDPPVGYSGDEDEGEKKYARRGGPHVQFLRALGMFWKPALHALPVTHSKKEKEDPEDAGDAHRLRRARSQKGGGGLDPRKLLLGLAIGSCMATMMLLYYRLAQGSVGGGGLLP